MASFDGTSKSSEGGAQNIFYGALRNQQNPQLQQVIVKAMNEASPEAIAFLDPLSPKRPDAVDVSGLTNEQWVAERITSIGSSEAAQVFGESPFPNCTNLDLYYKKTGQSPVIPQSKSDEERQERMFLWGHLLEEYLHLIVKQQFDGELIIDTNRYSTPDRPYLTANLDGMMKLKDGGYVHLEFKTTGEFNKDAYAFDSIPPYYKRQLIQCQHILGVWVSYLIVCFGRDEYKILRYDRDLDAEYEQIMECDDFWNNNVLAKIPPEPKGPPAHVVETIRRFKGYANKNLPPIALSRNSEKELLEIRTIDDRLAEIRKEEKLLKELRAEAMIPLVEQLGTTEKGIVSVDNCRYLVSYTPVAGRRTCDWDKFQLNHPDIYNLYVTKPKEAGRTLKIIQLQD